MIGSSSSTFLPVAANTAVTTARRSSECVISHENRIKLIEYLPAYFGQPLLFSQLEFVSADFVKRELVPHQVSEFHPESISGPWLNVDHTKYAVLVFLVEI